MFWVWIGVAMLAIVALTMVGAAMARRNPDTEWEKREDRPIIGHDH